MTDYLCIGGTNGIEATAEREAAKNTCATRMLRFDYRWGGCTRLGGPAITGPSRSRTTLVERVANFDLLAIVVCERTIEVISLDDQKLTAKRDWNRPSKTGGEDPKLGGRL
jgi:hypothetical protein